MKSLHLQQSKILDLKNATTVYTGWSNGWIGIGENEFGEKAGEILTLKPGEKQKKRKGSSPSFISLGFRQEVKILH